MDEHLGAEARAALPSHLPPQFRAFDPGGVDASGWVPFALVVAVDRGIARLAAPAPVHETFFALGRRSAERQFAAGLPPAPSVQHHFWDGKLHHSEFGDFGTCTYVPLEQRALRMEYREYPVMSRSFCLSGQGFLERSLELLGGRDPIVEEASCQCYGDPSCSFRVSWE